MGRIRQRADCSTTTLNFCTPEVSTRFSWESAWSSGDTMTRRSAARFCCDQLPFAGAVQILNSPCSALASGSTLRYKESSRRTLNSTSTLSLLFG